MNSNQGVRLAAAEPGKVRLAKAETDLKLASDTGLKVDNIINSSLLKVLAKFDYAFPLRTENTYESVKKLWNESQDTEFRNFSTCIRAKFSSAGINKTLSNKAIEKSLNNGFSRSQHYLVVANIDRLFQNGELIESRPDKNNDPNIISIKRFCSPFYIVENNKFAEVVLTVKESLLHGNRLYSLELDEIRKPSIPNKEGLDKQANTPAIDGYLNIAEKIEFANNLLKSFPKKYGIAEAGEDLFILNKLAKSYGLAGDPSGINRRETNRERQRQFYDLKTKILKKYAGDSVAVHKVKGGYGVLYKLGEHTFHNFIPEGVSVEDGVSFLAKELFSDFLDYPYFYLNFWRTAHSDHINFELKTDILGFYDVYGTYDAIFPEKAQEVLKEIQNKIHSKTDVFLNDINFNQGLINKCKEKIAELKGKRDLDSRQERQQQNHFITTFKKDISNIKEKIAFCKKSLSDLKKHKAENIEFINKVIDRFKDLNFSNEPINIPRSLDREVSIKEENAVYERLKAFAAGELQREPEAAGDKGSVRFAKGTTKKQTDTPQFKEWFGDSKVVDEKGEPLVVYHGTGRYGFWRFREYSFFTADKSYAKKYCRFKNRQYSAFLQ